jgi:hypothetical protein
MFLYTPLRHIGRVAEQLHPFLTSALDGGEWSALRNRRFNPGENAFVTYWLGDWDRPQSRFWLVGEKKNIALLHGVKG